MLQTFNRQLERFMPFITPASVIIGVLLANSLTFLSFLVPWIFAFITFSGSLSSNFSALKGVLKNPVPLIAIFILLHGVMPFIAWITGHLIFTDDYLTVTGLVLGVIIPTGITSFMWISIYKGNIALGLAIILLDTILSPFVVPYSLSLFVGQRVEMDTLNIMYGLLFMIVIPSILGMFINQATNGNSVKIGKTLAPFSKISLGIVVMINASAVAPYLKEFNSKLALIALSVFVLAFIGYLLAWMVAKWLKRDKETTVAMMFTGGMRNISAGAVLAVQYFPAAVAVVVIIGMLFQQVLASIFGFLFNRFETREEVLEKTKNVS